jgi:hypothetical protein
MGYRAAEKSRESSGGTCGFALEPPSLGSSSRLGKAEEEITLKLFPRPLVSG